MIAFVLCEEEQEYHPTCEIYRINADGSGQRRLGRFASYVQFAWSPDGTQIAFSSQHEGNDEIYVMDADGSHTTNLSNHPAIDANLSWAARDSRILFVSDRTGQPERYAVNADGSGLTRLERTNVPIGFLSPDGKQIAYSAPTDAAVQPPTGEDVPRDLYVIDIDGSHLVNLTNSPADDWGLAWSPDGRRLAFRSSSTPLARGKDLYSVNVDGSGLTKLASSPGDVWDPVWSPDGSHIVFAAEHDVAGGQDIYVVRPEGAGLTRLTSGLGDHSPAWSPDGARIVFVSRRDGSDEVYVMNVGGSGQTRITKFGKDEPFISGTPLWAPAP